MATDASNRPRVRRGGAWEFIRRIRGTSGPHSFSPALLRRRRGRLPADPRARAVESRKTLQLYRVAAMKIVLENQFNPGNCVILCQQKASQNPGLCRHISLLYGWAEAIGFFSAAALQNDAHSAYGYA
jgi:hypothetical protein